MVFQSYALYPHMTVGENMAFPLVLAGVDKSTIKSKVDEAATMLELTNHLDRKPANLSGGQRQRVAMGRAIVRSPKAFLMDEPLSNLDAKLRVQMRTQVARIQKTLATTTLYVTHDQTEAMTLGDRVVVMRGGLVQQVGSPTDLYEHPQNLFVAGFIGSPSMNFIEVDVVRDGGRPMLRSADGIELPLPSRFTNTLTSAAHLTAGIRPEHLEVGDIPGETAALRATIDVVEFLGNEELLHARVGDKDIVAVVDSSQRIKPGDVLDIKVPLEELHLFDEEGKSLAYATA
jgi:multiple sugar transport system ATP-binding protein